MTELPSTWRRVPLADLANGGLFCDGDWVESKDQDPEGEVRLTQLADVGVGLFRHRSDRWMRRDQAESLKCTYLSVGDVLIARMPDPLGRACLVPEGLGQAVTAVDVAVLRVARDDVEPRFVMWALNSPDLHGQMVALQSGTTRKRISRKNLGSVHVPLPPIDEQWRIVEILEDHLSRLDAGTHMLGRIVSRSLSLRAAGRRRAFGRIESECGLTPLLEVSTIANGQTPKGVLDLVLPEASPGSIPYFKVGDMNVGDGRWMESARNYIAPRAAASVGLAVRPVGTVLIPKRGGAIATNKKRILREPGCFDLNTMGLVAGDKLDPGYLWHWLVSVDLAAIADGSNVPQINAPQIRNLSLPLPSLAAQRAVSEELDEFDQTTARVRAEALAGVRRGKQLRRSLLAAAFSGRLT